MLSLTTILPSVGLYPSSSIPLRQDNFSDGVREEKRGGGANFINQASEINCYEVSPINSPFGFNNLGGRLNNLCRDLSFIEGAAQKERETQRGRDAVTQIASQRTVPLRMTVMKYNYQQDLLKNSSTAPWPSKETTGKKILHTKQVLTDQTFLFPAAPELSFQFFSVYDMLSHCKAMVRIFLWKRSANYIKA